MVALTLVLLAGCGDDKNANGDAPGIPGLWDSSVPGELQSLLNGDLELARNARWVDGVTQYAPYFNTTRLDGPQLFAYFASAAKVVVGETFPWRTSYFQSGFLQLNAYGANDYPIPNNSTQVYTVMTNVGGSLYRAGKPRGIAYALKTSRGTFRATSPLIGMYQIGAGLVNAVNQAANVPLGREGQRWMRFVVAVHERRHCDGNGSNVAFPHVLCSTGKYADGESYACDDSTNGPYSLEAMALYGAYVNCQTCSTAEYQKMSALITDYAGRREYNSYYKDPTPEGRL